MIEIFKCLFIYIFNSINVYMFIELILISKIGEKKMNYSTNLWNNWLIPKLYTSTKPEASMPIEILLDAEKSKLSLQLRDARMLGVLMGAKFMTTPQLTLCFWEGKNSSKTCIKRLNTLWDYGLLARIRPRAKSRTGSLPWIWAITKRGVQILERSGLTLYEERLKKDIKFNEMTSELPSQNLLRHSILISEFGSQCLASGGDWYFDHETASTFDIRISTGKSKLYYPDSILEWPKKGGVQETWLLELERSANQPRFREKMHIWKSLKILGKADQSIKNKYVVIVGRIKDTLPDRDERSIIPLAKIIESNGELTEFIKFIGIPNELEESFEAIPLDAVSFLKKHGG